ncbi:MULTISPECIES: phosphate acetyltransferase [unclassified Candidatus Frackibacter]|uniref:phosphate acetyltransferase n=1 Tax=unclassified Candidatus Frackibacter TaxID=2648818 RepID=UPI00088E373F|nr:MULTISPECIES: phosphate acetyltransferase [unclassified Candidatus Frackibacter]SDC51543.1 phosphotransacetylase [Candidatus Frackibacter sp. WG11]SEM41013.1 phosphotransacetylase [Candidatus Frackibacter sp. WG12]SFL75561.1 phosphotransacetylase [Candidatus Frackibacter sp. WG13]
MGFVAEIKEKAKAAGKTIVLPEGIEPRMIKATPEILKEGLAEVILLGDEDELNGIAKQEGVDISGAEIINPETAEKLDEFGQSYYELRKHKGISKEEAKKQMTDSLYFGAMLVKKGIADGMVAGALNTTANVLRPVIRIIGTADDVSIVSGSFLMIVPDCEYGVNGKMLFADSGVFPEGSPEELAELAISSAETFEALTGEEPVVAMLSFSTKGSAEHPLVDKMKKAAEICKEKAPELQVDGEMQADAALVPEIGAKKAPDSDVAGKANVLIFPDLNGGNIAYKLVQRLAKADAFGPLIQGTALPANDLSRGCSVDDIVTVAAITAVQAVFKDN